jgi:hypothetical protein
MVRMSIHDRRMAGAAVRGREVGSLIGGGFGLAFVWINSGAVPAAARGVLLAVAVAALLAIVVLSARSFAARAGRSEPSLDAGASTTPDAAAFGWRYWSIVAIEAVALFGGARVLSVLGHPELGIAWVAVVVGTHFFALARVFRLARFHVLGALVTALGLAGFALGAVGRDDAIPIVSGVVTGFVLLGFGLWALAPVRTLRS